VIFDVEGAKISNHENTAWISTTVKIIQTSHHDKAMIEYAKMMRSMLEGVNEEGKKANEMIMEATHYGIRRLRERSLGIGYPWAFTFTAVLIFDNKEWKFHTIHWSMPVD